MKRLLQTLALGAALSFSIAGCGDSESGGNDGIGDNPDPMQPMPDPDPLPDPDPDPDPMPEERVTLNVGVFAPMQNMAYELEKASGFDMLVSLLGSEAFAQNARPASFMPVNNATLEVQVIAPDGSVARTIIADVTPLGDGRYQVVLPPGEDIAPDCIILARDALNMPLRVPLVQRNIDITPVTEFLTSQLVGTPGSERDYSNISLDEVRALLDQVNAVTIPGNRTETIEDIIAVLSEIAGENITAAVSDAEDSVDETAQNPAFAFAVYDGSLIELGMQGFDGGDDPNARPFPNGSIDVAFSDFNLTLRSDGNNGAELFVDDNGSQGGQFELFNRTFAFGNTFGFDGTDVLPVRVLTDGSIVVDGSTEQDLPPAGAENSSGESIGSIESAPATTLHAAANNNVLLETYRRRVTEYLTEDANGDDVPDGLNLNEPRSFEFFSEPNFYVKRPTGLQVSEFTGQYGTLDMFISLESGRAEFCVEASQYTLSSGTGSESFEDDYCITRDTTSGIPTVAVENNQDPNAQLSFRNVESTGKLQVFEETPDGDLLRRGRGSADGDFFVTLTSDINDRGGNSAALNFSARLPTTTPALDGKNFNLQGVGMAFGDFGLQSFSDFRAATLSFSQADSQLTLNLGGVRTDVITQLGLAGSDRGAPRRSTESTGINSMPITVTSNGRIRGEVVIGGGIVRINGFVDATGTVFVGQLITENAEGSAASAMLIYGTPTDKVAVSAADAALRAALNGGWELTGKPAGASDLAVDSFLVFGADNEYHEVDIDDPNNGTGFEFGAFSVSNSKLNVTGLVDQNGDSGLVSFVEGQRSSGFPITVVGDTLTLTIEGEGDFEFTRVASATGSLPGCWDIQAPEDDDDEVMFCYLSSERYLAIQPFQSINEIGIEFGSFTTSADVIEHTATVDTSGRSLTNDWIAPTEFAVSSDVLTLTILDDDSADAEEFDVSFDRVR